MTRRPPTRRLLRYAAIGGAVSLAYACSHPWDDYDPRLSSGGTCKPGDTQACYTGPAATRHVGPCKDGVQICDATQQWGTCTGETLPVVEDCTTAADDDCDGTPNEHCGVWGFAFGATGANTLTQAYAMAVTPAGHVVVGGAGKGTLIVGDGGAPLSDTGDGAFTVELDTPPAHPVSTRYGGGSGSAVTAIALDNLGGVLLGGEVFDNQQVSVPGLSTPLKNGSTTYDWDFFLARLDLGKGLWQALGDGMMPGQETQPNAVILLPNGVSYVAGYFQSWFSFADAGTPFTAKGAAALVLKLDATGGTTWNQEFGTGATAYTAALAPAANIVLVGGAYNDGTLKLGAKSLPGTGQPSGMVVELSDMNGQILRARGYPAVGTPAAVRVDAIAVDHGKGEVVVAGRFAGAVDFGAPEVELGSDGGTPGGGPGCMMTPPKGNSDVFVARLRVADLSCVWVKTFGNGGGLDGPAGTTIHSQQFGPVVAVDSTGAALVAANYGNTLQVDTWTLTSHGLWAVVLMKIDAAGNLSWVRSFGGGKTYATALAVDDTDDAYVAGQFTGTLELTPTLTLTAPALTGKESAFVARIAH
jgi:hypothetical protein